MFHFKAVLFIATLFIVIIDRFYVMDVEYIL